MKKTKWWIYTVLIGLIPFFIRLLFFLTAKNLDYNYVLNEVDMITFGLVLSVTNINELEDRTDFDKDWKTLCIGISIFLLVIMSAFLGLAYFSDLDKGVFIEKQKIKFCSLAISFLSLLFSISIFYKPKFVTNA